MKTKNGVLSVFACSLLMVSFVLVSCDKEQTPTTKGKLLYDVISKASFSLENQTELNQLATALAKEVKQITLLNDASVITLTDRKGDFKAISVSYTVDGVVVKMVVPIAEVSSDQVKSNSQRPNRNTYYVVDAESCVMKCSTVSPCDASSHEIIERCKNQTCGCTSGSTGAEASVAFNNE